MAEAHSAVAFSFSVTPDGVDVKVNHEAIKAVWFSGIRSWKKSIGRFKNGIKNGVYPASTTSLIFIVAVVFGFYFAGIDVSFGLVKFIETLPFINTLSSTSSLYLSLILFSTVVWISYSLATRYTLKLLLNYTGWMYEPRNKMSLFTKLWIGVVKMFLGKKPQLYSYQGSLPHLPVPALDSTMTRYLLSVRPLLTDSEYSRMEKLASEFQNGIGRKLQRYLILKSWWATNYVSDWWEEYVYLRGRAPIMVNSNYYGIDAVLRHPTKIQAARAANVVYSMLQFRRSEDREEMSPILLNKTVPLCSWQYERQFNTTRIPGIETDTLVHYKDSQHIVVYHKGRYYKVYIYHRHQLLTPPHLELLFQKILDDPQKPAKGEEQLAALTAGDRVPWAKARAEFFSVGVNKSSLHAIEKAAFVLAFDDEPQDFDKKEPQKLDNFGCAMLHGNGYNRWFDKSFTLVVSSNGRIGFNGEHSWADAPVMAHLWEHVMCCDDIQLGYDEKGHTKGEVEFEPPSPIKLAWDIPDQCIEVIESSLKVARDLYNDVDLNVMMHDEYGKGFMKQCRISPDAFIQIALQLAYFRDVGKFCLTYEASMTRLFREGRTETVRSCTVQSLNLFAQCK